MLFVDDDHTEAVELDRLLDESVGSDHEIDLSVGKSGQNVAASFASDRIGEQFDPNGSFAEEIFRIGNEQAVEKCRYSCGMLFGQHLGGSHQGPLVAAVDGCEHGRHGDQGFSRTHVTLEETVHRCRRTQIDVDFTDHSTLCPREGIRQLLEEPSNERTSDHVLDSRRLALDRPLAHHQNQLHPQELVECQTTASHLLCCESLGKVNAFERFTARYERVFAPEGLWNRIGDSSRTTS